MHGSLRLLSPLLIALAATQAMAADLTLKRVMLSTAGVGYVEYAAPADGPATFQLAIPLDQVDDVLKSIVVFDSRGGVGSVELPPRDHGHAAFGNVPFGPDALTTPAAYLTALRGVTVDVLGPRPMTGRLLGVETERTGEGEATQTRVSLLTTDGLRQFVLEDADAVRVADPALRSGVERAMDAMRRDAARDQRVMTLRGSGTGAREVRVGYVAGAALWKTSYRLILPTQGAPAPSARLQGWAVLENTTGRDWDGVELTLQYGNPVSFRQALYRTYFVQRPEVPVQILGQILPDIDTRASDMKLTRDSAAERSAPAMAPAMALAAPPPPTAPSPMPRMAPPAEQARGTEGAEETVFTLPTPVVLPAGHTASVPILDREVTATRIGLVPYGKPHPLASVRLTNDGATSLPAGVLTLYDPASPAMFSGDARLGGLPKGETRLLSFAEDLRTAITWRPEETTTIAALTAAEGVVRYEERLRWTARIGLTAPAGEARTLLLEIPKRANFTPAADQAPAPAEETASAWRFPATLTAGEQREITVRLDRVTRQQVALTADDRLITRLLGVQGLDDRARAALQRLVSLNADVARRTAERDRLQASRAEIEANEDRIRKNLAAVPANDALHGRLVRQLDAEEKRIGDLRAQIERAETEVTKARETLAAAITGVRF